MNTLKKIGFGVCLGAAVGIAAGILFATKEGRTMRKTLKEKAIDSIDDLEEHVQDGSKEWNATAAHAAKKANQVIRNVDAKADTLQEDLTQGYNKIKHDVNQAVASDTKQGKTMEKKWQDKLDETIETVKNVAEEKSDDLSDAAAQAAAKTEHFVKEAAETAEDVGEEIKDGYHAIKHDLHRPGNV
ncbi:MAG: YtxH domain-containing protein [Negativicutes bacterium]|nr:YtxH domain-containing protein [Negativicutes bacterium]